MMDFDILRAMPFGNRDHARKRGRSPLFPPAHSHKLNSGHAPVGTRSAAAWSLRHLSRVNIIHNRCGVSALHPSSTEIYWLHQHQSCLGMPDSGSESQVTLHDGALQLRPHQDSGQASKKFQYNMMEAVGVRGARRLRLMDSRGQTPQRRLPKNPDQDGFDASNSTFRGSKFVTKDLDWRLEEAPIDPAAIELNPSFCPACRRLLAGRGRASIDLFDADTNGAFFEHLDDFFLEKSAQLGCPLCVIVWNAHRPAAEQFVPGEHLPTTYDYGSFFGDYKQAERPFAVRFRHARLLERRGSVRSLMLPLVTVTLDPVTPKARMFMATPTRSISEDDKLLHGNGASSNNTGSPESVGKIMQWTGWCKCQQSTRRIIQILEAEVTYDGTPFMSVSHGFLRLLGPLFRITRIGFKDKPKRDAKSLSLHRSNIVQMMSESIPGYTGENLKYIGVSDGPLPIGAQGDQHIGLDVENGIIVMPDHEGDHVPSSSDMPESPKRNFEMDFGGKPILDEDFEAEELENMSPVFIPVLCTMDTTLGEIEALKGLVLAESTSEGETAYWRLGVRELNEYTAAEFFCELGNQEIAAADSFSFGGARLKLEDIVPDDWAGKELDFVPKDFACHEVIIILEIDPEVIREIH